MHFENGPNSVHKFKTNDWAIWSARHDWTKKFSHDVHEYLCFQIKLFWLWIISEMLIVLLAWFFLCFIIDFKNPETSEITRLNNMYAAKGQEKSARGFILNSCAGCGLYWAFLAWENSQHFSTPLLVSTRHNVWETSAEILSWRRVTTQMWVVFLIGHAVRQTSTSKKHYPELGCD